MSVIVDPTHLRLSESGNSFVSGVTNLVNILSFHQRIDQELADILWLASFCVRYCVHRRKLYQFCTEILSHLKTLFVSHLKAENG
jgi:hypothetical protein